MKKIVLYLIFLVMSTCICRVYAQSGTGSAGTDAIGAGGSVSYSIGLTNFIQIADTLRNITQGIQQADATLVGPVSGPQQVCVGDTLFYSVPVVLGALTYQWQLPNGFVMIGGTGTNQIQVIAGQQSGFISVVAINGNGNYPSNNYSVTVHAFPNPISLQITQTDCIRNFGSIAFLTPTGTGFQFAVNGIWGSSSIITGLQPGFYTAAVQNQYGCKLTYDSVIQILPQPIIPAAPQITGFVNVCSFIGNDTSITYQAYSDGATAYNWTIPPQVTLLSGQGTATIQVKFLNGFLTQANKQLKARAENACGISSETSLGLFAQKPSRPEIIEVASTDICQAIQSGTAIRYSIPKVVSATFYEWTISDPNTSLVHPNGLGINDTSILVFYNQAFQSAVLYVKATSSCGVGDSRSVNILRNNPTRPGIITGPVDACPYMGPAQQPAVYTVPTVTGVNFQWQIPDSAILISGQGTASIQLAFLPGFILDTLQVFATNGCGVSLPRSIVISKRKPANPTGIFSRVIDSCPVRILEFSILALPAYSSSVVWTVPSGCSLLSGQGSTTIRVLFPPTALNGYIQVKGINICSEGQTRSLYVRLPACPPIFVQNKKSRSSFTVGKQFL